MVTKVLFLDTSVLIKLHKKERGSNVVKWLLSPEFKITNRLYFVINKRVCEELESKLKKLGEDGILRKKYTDLVISQFKRFYKNNYFRVIGQNIISNKKTEQLLPDIISDFNLKPGKNDWDAEHYQSIVNALAYLGGRSKPILVSCDQKFYKKVRARGFKVIDPIKHSQHDIKAILA